MKALLPFALLLLASFASPVFARNATNAERAACEEQVQRRIDAIDARMRMTYDVREGERLRERRRRLEVERANCRTVDESPPSRDKKAAKKQRK